ncbi:hypothetical protein BDV29DRAFT_158379 [Aspergillus leporis]|uniref:Extracellular membrane protein CFEM domain-containing protein n=1 Tax=Aspergillus leporis TaxID=41062 RepID=A0A5N5WZU3_9EURO|nr:hypothetical protein BDV29DRAFT_158379 [Aspergillus leporis]
MHLSQSVLCTLLLAFITTGADIDANDVPSQCQQVCAPVVSLTASCDRNTNDDDRQEIDCICKDSKAPTSIPLCEACIAQNSRDGHDNDANDLIRSCSFATTSYDPTSIARSSHATTGSSTGSPSGSATGSATELSPAQTSNPAAKIMSSPEIGLWGLWGSVVVVSLTRMND